MDNAKKIGRPSKGGKDYDSIVAKRLREIIGGETNQETADKVGISRQAVGRITSGENKPDIDTLIKFANAYKVSTDYLLGLSKVKSLNIAIKEVCTFTNLDEETVTEIANIGSSYSTILAEFVKEGHLKSILNAILLLKSAGEDFLKSGEEASTIIDTNRFEEYRHKDLDAYRYKAFSTFEGIMNEYDVRIAKKDEISILSEAIFEINKKFVEDNSPETLKKVREYERRKNNGTDRKENE